MNAVDKEIEMLQAEKKTNLLLLTKSKSLLMI